MPQTAKQRRASLRNLAKARRARKQMGGFMVPPQFVTKPMYAPAVQPRKTAWVFGRPTLKGAGRKGIRILLK